MGEVFLAREEALRRACVVKKVLPRLMESPQFVGRFRDEARVMVRLAHPNIARVYAMGEVDGQLYLAMEYVQGKTLSRLAYRLRQLGRTVPLGILLHLGERLCEGLAYAHEARDEEGRLLHLVHRDLSPANVCLSYAGEVKIIDFGAAQSTLKEQHTAPRVVIGNLTYMAPEQARKRFVDRRADVYAVGALLWELVAWRPLAQRGDPVERWRRAAYPTWEPAGRFRKGVPPGLDALLMRALAPEPEQRFADAAELGAELARLKVKLTPGATDADVARLMAVAFPREKQAEEKALAELLRGDASRLRTEREFAAVLTPPNALAFEHSGIDTPEDFFPSADSASGPAEGPDDAGDSGDRTLPADPDRERRGAVARTAMYGVNERGADAATTDALEASKVLGAINRATASGPEAPKAPGTPGGAAAGGPEGSRGPGAMDRVPTEALEMSKVLVAIERAEAARGSGARKALPPRDGEASVTATPVMAPQGGGEQSVSVTPVMAPRGAPSRVTGARRVPRETQVGFGVDISRQVDSAAMEARRMELVRAITGEGEATLVRRDRPWVRRALLLALAVGACALGLGLGWVLR